ncbi:hypothetical protein D3C83_80680 [compost metagenome]
MAKGQKKPTREIKKPKKAAAAKPAASGSTSFTGKISGTSYQDFYRKKTTSNG